MNDYKMEVHKPSGKKIKGTRCYDLEKVLDLGRSLMRIDKDITKIVFEQPKQNNKVTLRRNEDAKIQST